MSASSPHASPLESLRYSNEFGFLDAIDSLRSEGASHYVSLPQLIVCGDQSSGKSSVLEAISGIPFPTNNSLCTRFATELILRRTSTVDLSISIVPSRNRSAAEHRRLSEFRKSLTNFDELPILIEKAKELMGISTTSSAFSNDILRVVMSGPTQQQLTIVDLPGLIHSATELQTSADVALVKSMVESYMANPRSIILAVVSAKNHYANQIVIKLAKDIDSKGHRTLGIITKPDTLPVGSKMEVACANLARNQVIEFRLGWHVLRNRDYKTTNTSMEARDIAEEQFFSQGLWRDFPRNLVGVSSLRARLSQVLLQQIQKTMLFWAAESGHEAVVQLLLQKGADIEVTDDSGQTPLFQAAENGHEAVVRLLLKKGADIEATDDSDQTALLRAAKNGHEAVVQVLLKNGANMELMNRQASTISRSISSPFDSEESDSSVEDDSVFSTPISLLSTMTSGSGTGIDTLLSQEFAALLRQDGALTSLIAAGVSKQRIGLERMRNNFRKLLKHYAEDLKAEMSDGGHRALIGFVSSYSANISQELFSKTSMSDQEAEAGIPEPIKKPRDAEDRRKKVEEYLQKMLDPTGSTASAQLARPNSPSKSNVVDERNENSESDEDSDQYSVAEGAEEPYDGSLKHMDRLKLFILESIAYQNLLRRLHEFIQPSLRSRLRDLVAVWSMPDHRYHTYITRYKLSNLVAELQYIHPHEIRFDSGEGDGYHAHRATSYYQNVVECWTGEQWDWWPLAPPSRSLEQWETRIRWKCTCGEERQTEVPYPFAKRLKSIIRNLPKEVPSMQGVQSPPVSHLRNSSPRDSHGNGEVPGQPYESGQGNQQSSGSSSANALHYLPSRLKAKTADINIPDHRILFIVKQNTEYKLAQICVNGLNSHTFFSALRHQYFHLRGFLRSWFSVWRYSHCDFYMFEKFEDHEFTPKHKDVFPEVANTDYEFQPKPMDSIPPVSEHEFKKRFYACHRRQSLLHWHYQCTKLGLQSHDLLKLFPKKRTKLEEGGDKREDFWGIYAREIISLRWVLFYNFICIVPMLAFFMVWVLPRGHSTDLQNPSVPISMMTAMLSLFWSLFLSSLQFGKSH